MSSASGDVHVFKDSLKCEQILMKSNCSLSGNCLMAKADDTDIIAGPARRNSITTFEAFTSVHCDMTDGQIEAHILIALQICVNKKTCFLCPEKPKRNQQTINLKRKKIKFDKILDKKDSEIEGKYRKYWFKLKRAGDSSQVYESLAYPGFFISVEGSDVLMRKCGQGVPIDRNYHIQTLPAFKSKFKVEERTFGSQPLNLHEHIPNIRITADTHCGLDVKPGVSDDQLNRRESVESPAMSTRADVHSVTESSERGEELSTSRNGEVLVAHSNASEVFPPGHSSVTSSSMSSPTDDISRSVAESSLENVSTGRNGRIPSAHGNTVALSPLGNSSGSDPRVLGAEVIDKSKLKVKDDKIQSCEISDVMSNLDTVEDNKCMGESQETSFDDPGQISQAADTEVEHKIVNQRDKNKDNTLIDQDLRNRSTRVKGSKRRGRSFIADLFSCVSSNSVEVEPKD